MKHLVDRNQCIAKERGMFRQPDWHLEFLRYVNIVFPRLHVAISIILNTSGDFQLQLFSESSHSYQQRSFHPVSEPLGLL